MDVAQITVNLFLVFLWIFTFIVIRRALIGGRMAFLVFDPSRKGNPVAFWAFLAVTSVLFAILTFILMIGAAALLGIVK